MKIDLKEVVHYIDLHDLPEGRFNIDIELPDRRSVNLKGYIEYRGYRTHSYNDPDDNGYFFGTIHFNLYDWDGFDADGKSIPVINSTWFENKIEEILNKNP